jgi:putative transposase
MVEADHAGEGDRSSLFQLEAPRDSEADLAAAIRSLMDCGGPSRLQLIAAAKEFGLSLRTVQRRLSALRATGTTSGMLPKRRGPQPGTSRLAPEIEQIIDSVIDEHHLRRERPKNSKTIERISLECRSRGFTPPAPGTVRKRIRDRLLDRASSMRRDGPAVARQEHQHYVGSSAVKNRLDQVQIDHTRGDIMLLVRGNGCKPCRPFISVAIDVATRCILGLNVGFEAPSRLTNAVLMSQVLCRKVPGDDHPAGTVWGMSGVPKEILVDNGADFQSDAFRAGCKEFQIKLLYRPVGAPHVGGIVERLMRSIADFTATLPGRTGGSIRDRGDYDPEANASLTLEDFRSALLVHVLEQYHTSPHRTLGVAPEIAWNDSENDVRTADRISAFYAFLPSEIRQVRRTGIELFGLRYWSEALRPISPKEKLRVRVMYDPRDVGRAFVKLEDEIYPLELKTHVQGRISFEELRRVRIEAKARSSSSSSLRRKSEAASTIDGIVARSKRILRPSRNTESDRRVTERQLAPVRKDIRRLDVKNTTAEMRVIEIIGPRGKIARNQGGA